MIPFQLPRWRKRQISRKFSLQDKITAKAVSDMEVVMKDAITYVFEHYEKMGMWVEPSLNAVEAVTDDFYRDVITGAFYAAQDEKKAQIGKTRLAKAPPKLPRKFDSLDKLFRNRRYWSRIMNRSKKLSASMRRQYLGKLKKQFGKVLPLIESGDYTVSDAKKVMQNAWNASKSRVETIFRTETTNYFAKTSISFFSDDEEIIGFLFDSVRDSSRTEICRSRHGLVYRPGTKALEENTPACHYNCRSHLIALANIPFNRKLLEDPKRDPSKRAVKPLPRGWRK